MNSLALLRQFFSNYFFLGLLLVLLAVIARLNQSEPPGPFVHVGIALLETVGIAVLVASVFTFASGTSEFINRIRELLRGIVIDRDFLSNIDAESKREVLKSLIQPSSDERGIYPNIEEYYDLNVDQLLNISKKSVRSNYSIHCRAFIDPDQKRVAVDGKYSYRLYPATDGYAGLQVSVDDPDSVVQRVSINTPDGKRETLDQIELNEENRGGDRCRKADVDIEKKIGEMCPDGVRPGHVDIDIDVVEFGSDHWILYVFKALQPTDGFRLFLRCESPLEVRSHAVLVVGANYYVDQLDERQIAIRCTEWISEGSGICVLIARPHEIEP